MTDLHKLRISLTEPPGSLIDVLALAVHQKLDTLQIDSVYDWDPHDLPELPGLRCLEITGTCNTIAAAIQARYAGRP
jgi:hypothetical protein